MQFDYTTLGHVTIDVLADGSRRPGGTAFYSALQAARLGLSARVITRGRPSELEELLDPYRTELHVDISPAARTTTFATWGEGAGRRQRLLAWAGPMSQDMAVETTIVHLAPVAREIPTRWRGDAALVGLTPQGLVREWSGAQREISLSEPTGDRAQGGSPSPASARPPGRGARAARGVAARCGAMVLSEQERAACGELIEAAAAVGAVVAVTAGPEPTTILLPDGETLRAPVPSLQNVREDLGAGDVFAAAFFVSLAEGLGAERAAAFASAAAAVRMEGAGPAALGTRRAIEARVLAGAGQRALRRRGRCR